MTPKDRWPFEMATFVPQYIHSSAVYCFQGDSGRADEQMHFCHRVDMELCLSITEWRRRILKMKAGLLPIS